jgi:hypothetical protein
MFYEMLTGELPLGRFAPPSKKAAVDARLDDVVFKALEKDPAQRYQHASEVRDDVTGLGAKPAQKHGSPALPASDGLTRADVFILAGTAIAFIGFWLPWRQTHMRAGSSEVSVDRVKHGYDDDAGWALIIGAMAIGAGVFARRLATTSPSIPMAQMVGSVFGLGFLIIVIGISYRTIGVGVLFEALGYLLMTVGAGMRIPSPKSLKG